MKKSFLLFVMFVVILGLVIVVAVTQAADSMTGTWELAVELNADKYNPTLIVQQDGENITGTIRAQFGGTKVTGKIQGSDFELSYGASYGAPVTYKGKVGGDKISGSVDMGSSGKGTFNGERQK
jgi:hypothetical protein